MIIKTLILKSFGKFQNTTIELKKGINVISGENESGKSTIHQFIEGMFYGFYKQNIKNKKISEAYEKYYPWDNIKDYSGVMIINDGRDIRIERNFMKNQDTVQIFDNITGEDITESYPYDPVSKTYQPALKHLKMNLSSYQNTISITQMQSKTSEELVGEIKDNIINLGETKSMDVSINNIMKKISEKKSAIGTERSKRSNYGKLKEEIIAIEDEMENTNIFYEEIKRLKLQEKHLSLELTELEDKKNNIESKMMFLKKREEEETLKKISQIKEEIEEINIQLNELDIFEEISKEEINAILIKLNYINIYKNLIEEENLKNKEIIKNREVLERKILEIGNIRIESGASEKISRDIYKYEELETSKKFSSSSIEAERIEELNEKVIKSKKGIMSNNFLLFITMVISLIPGSIKVFEFFGESLINEVNNSKMLSSLKLAKEYSLITLIGLLLMLFVSFLIWIQGRSKQNELNYLEEQINLANEIEESIKSRITNINERQEMILNQYNAKNIDDLYMLRDKKFKEELAYQEVVRKIKTYKDEIEALNKSIALENNKLREQKKIIEDDTNFVVAFMKKLGVNTDKELKNILDKYDTYKKLEQDKTNREFLLLEITKGKSYLSNMDIKTNQLELTDFQDEDIDKTYDEFEAELRNLNEEIVIRNKKISIISTEILNKENQVRNPAIIEEELNKKYKELEKMSFKLNTYNIIEEAITYISKNIQNNFAPKLNERVSKFIAIATDYKYTDIKVSQNLEVSVIDNELNKLIDVNSLSAGTIDLIYFALRLSISEVINNNIEVPIILDDSFVQYDERRLIKVLEFLSKLERQVMLFTCHNREVKIIKRITEDVNIINLRT